ASSATTLLRCSAESSWRASAPSPRRRWSASAFTSTSPPSGTRSTARWTRSSGTMPARRTTRARRERTASFLGSSWDSEPEVVADRRLEHDIREHHVQRERERGLVAERVLDVRGGPEEY